MRASLRTLRLHCTCKDTIWAWAAIALFAAGCGVPSLDEFDTVDFPIASTLPKAGTGSELLAASVEFPLQTYRVGDKIVADCKITNISDGPVKIARRLDGSYGRRCPIYRLYAAGRDGRLVPRFRRGPIDNFLNPIVRDDVIELRSGESHVEELLVYLRSVEDGKLWGERGLDLNAPGTHWVRFQFASDPGLSLGAGQKEVPEWLSSVVRCHISSQLARLELLPGTPREALERWRPEPPPDPVKFFGKRFIAPEPTRDKSPFPKRISRTLGRILTFEYRAEDTLQDAVRSMKDMGLPVGVAPEVAQTRLGTSFKLRKLGTGDHLYWLARLTGTRLSRMPWSRGSATPTTGRSRSRELTS